MRPQAYLYMSEHLRRDLLTEWWQIKKALRLCAGLYCVTARLRLRQRDIEQNFK